MKKIIIKNKNILGVCLLVIALNGCGGGTCSTDTVSNTSSAIVGTEFTVERGAVYGATVTDSSTPTKTATQRTSKNIYVFAETPTYPIKATGGWIDVDGDGIKTITDIAFDINMRSYSSNITPITTLCADENQTKRDALYLKLKEQFGIDVNELTKTSSTATDKKVTLLTNAIFKKVKETNSTIQTLYNYNSLVENNSTNLNNLHTEYNTLNSVGGSVMTNGSIDPIKLEKYVVSNNKTLFTFSLNQSYNDLNSTNGTFPTLVKSSNSSTENIWNIAIPVDVSTDYSNFNIGIKFLKNESDGTPDIGEFVFYNLSLSNGILSDPERILIKGVGDGGSGTSIYNTQFNENAMIQNSLDLIDNKIILRLGYIMKNQSMVSESTFKVQADYNLTIISSVPLISNSKQLTMELINSKYNFSNKNGVNGAIKIN